MKEMRIVCWTVIKSVVALDVLIQMTLELGALVSRSSLSIFSVSNVNYIPCESISINYSELVCK